MLFHVFIYHITSLRIFHLYEFFCTNISQVEKFLQILQPFSEAAMGGVPYRKPFSNILWYSQENNCSGLFFNKVAGHQAYNVIKKRLQHRYFIVNIGKFIRRLILKNISEQLHRWKVFCENVCQIRSELSKRNYWWLTVWKLAQISQDWIKMLPIIKYYISRLNS